MIAPASRLDGIQEYYFATKLREIAQMRAEGHPVINLGIGSPDLPPHPDVVAALHTSAADPAAHGYQSYTGLPALRRAWADWYARHYGVSIAPDQEVLPLIGSKEGIAHIAFTFLEAGAEALAPNPGYPTYRAATRLTGAEVREYTLDERHKWLPDLDALAGADLSKVKVMWINYPHMPTGAAADKAFFEDVVAFGKAHKILIVNDNPYSFILNDRPLSILAARDAFDIALELNSLSKSHNLAGWRLGALLGKGRYLSEVLRFKSNLDSGQFQAVQLAAAKALSADESWYRELNDQYRLRQQKAVAVMQMAGCQVPEGQQGMFVWGRIPAQYPDAYSLSDRLLHDARVFLTPGGIFGSAGEQYLRISLCQPVAVFEEALERVRQMNISSHTQPLQTAR